MNNQSVAEQKKDKKAFWKFIGIVVLATVLGGVLGVSMVAFEGGIVEGFNLVLTWLQAIAPWLLVAATVILLGAEFIALQIGKKQAAAVDPNADIDNAYETPDKTLSSALSLGNWYQVLNYTLFALGATAGIAGMKSGIFLMSVVAFMAGMFLNVALQNALVKTVKGMYPEKQGNVLDTKFQKDWMNSCDEAEQQMIGKAAQKSMQSTSLAIVVLFAASMILGYIGLVQPLLPLVLGVVWLVQTQSYMAEANRQENARKQK